MIVISTIKYCATEDAYIQLQLYWTLGTEIAGASFPCGGSLDVVLLIPVLKFHAHAHASSVQNYYSTYLLLVYTMADLHSVNAMLLIINFPQAILCF